MSICQAKRIFFCYFLVVKSKVTNIGAELDFSKMDGGEIERKKKGKKERRKERRKGWIARRYMYFFSE